MKNADSAAAQQRLRTLDAIQLPAQTRQAAPPIPDNLTANAGVVLNDNLIGISEDLGEASLRDVMDSTLLAMLEADQAFSKFTRFNAWFNHYLEALRQLGWVTQAREKATWEGHENFHPNEVALALLEKQAGRQTRTLMEQCLQRLSHTEVVYNRFLYSARKEKYYSFRMLACTESPQGDIQMPLLAVHTGTSYSGKVTAKLGILPVHNEFQALVLPKGAYDEWRQPVRRKLHDLIKQLLMLLHR